MISVKLAVSTEVDVYKVQCGDLPKEPWKDLLWGVCGSSDNVSLGFLDSINPAYLELIRRITYFKDQNETEIALKSGRYGVYGGFTNDKYLVTYDIANVSMLTSFRLMKKNCMYNNYLVFALQKFSPYTELFSDHALKFQEHGFADFWHSVTYRDKRWLKTFFENYPKESRERTPLNLKRVSGALIILIMCHMLSIVVFVGELMYH